MNSEKPKKHKKLKIVLVIIAAVVAVCAVAFAVYVNDYYRADDIGVEATEDVGAYASDDVSVQQSGNTTAFVPPEPFAGLIFYPGGKVAPEAYSPLMQQLAADGVLCVVCKMPFNLAVFGISSADGIKDEFPQVPSDKWYIGGHSLGGSMAAAYLDGHSGDFAGLVLLAAYSTADLGDTEEKVISLYGSEDHVLNADKYKEYASNIPGVDDVVIEGGNHGQFGSYGQQAGDGNATISVREQWSETARAIVDWMKSN